MKNQKLLLRTVLLLTFTLSPLANGFTLVSSSIKKGWAGKSLTFKVNEASCTALGVSASNLNEAIDAAIDLWNSVTTSKLKLQRSGTSDATTATDEPTIYCSNTLEDGVGGVGGVGATSSEGRPTSGSININANAAHSTYFNSLSVTLRAIIMAHEMGHVLGLGHTQKQYALMYYDISGKGNLSLAQDDVDGLTWLNPSSEPGDALMGCGSITAINGSGKGNGPSSPSAAITFALYLAVIYAGSRMRFGKEKSL